MNAHTLLGALAGAGVGIGFILVLLGLRPDPEVPGNREPRASWKGTRQRSPQALAALAIGLLVWLVSSWPVAGLISAITVLGLPVLLSTSREAARGIARVEAVEEWTRRLSDILVVGVGLEQAIITSVRSVPEPIRVEVATLGARLSARWPSETALRAFADELGDATGDLVVASLILGHRRRGPGLARALTAVADSVSQEVAMRRRVEADRAKPRTTARAVTFITLGVVCIGALNPTYLKPYGTGVGQLVLLGVTALFVGALAWMRLLTLPVAQARLLKPADAER